MLPSLDPSLCPSPEFGPSLCPHKLGALPPFVGTQTVALGHYHHLWGHKRWRWGITTICGDTNGGVEGHYHHLWGHKRRR
jgi:hypothetical protein